MPAVLARAKATIEARAKERHALERAEHEAKLKAREAKTAATGKKPPGRPPAAPVEGPLPTDQVNLTDQGSRIMPVAGGGLIADTDAEAVVVGELLAFEGWSYSPLTDAEVAGLLLLIGHDAPASRRHRTHTRAAPVSSRTGRTTRSPGVVKLLVVRHLYHSPSAPN
jgi:hypothetical protein